VRKRRQNATRKIRYGAKKKRSSARLPQKSERRKRLLAKKKKRDSARFVRRRKQKPSVSEPKPKGFVRQRSQGRRRKMTNARPRRW
jgi:IMP dehydrogenase/GMP reductase